MNIIAFRHAESIKNIKDIHGGTGMKLTQNGKENLLKMCNNRMFENIASPCILTGGTSEHIVASGDLLSKRLNIRTEWNSEFDGIHLGVLHGLCSDDAKTRFPDSYQLLNEWATGNLNLQELSIPEMETIESFKGRVMNKIRDYSETYETTVLIGSRSVLILLKNIVEMGNDFQWDNYKAYSFDYTNPVKWSINF